MTEPHLETQPEPRPSGRGPEYSSVILCAVFFLSGSSALIFETLWFRLASLTFGNSVWACALVLTSFMGGLALGNALTVVYGFRVRRPVRLYAIVETTIAVAGVGLVLVFPMVTGWLAPLFRAYFDTQWVIACVRLVASFGLMMIPATAMGITLPLLVRALHQDSRNYGRALGRLYGWNTLGAVFGTVLAEVVLVGLLGIRGTGLLAGLLNLASALTALRLARSVTETHLNDSEGPRPEPNRSLVSLNYVLLLFCAFVAGAILLALEDIWFRFLLLFVRGHTLAFAVMLAVVLAGIGIGGMLASWWFRVQPRAHDHLAEVAFLTGTISILAYLSFDYFPHQPSASIPEWAFILINAVPLMLPVSLLSGVLFTLIGSALFDKIGTSLEATGLLTSVNTIGAVVGSVAGGFIFLPQLGMEKSFFVLSLGYAGIAGAALIRQRFLWSKSRLMVTGTLGAGFVCAVFLFPFGSMDRHMLAVGERFCPIQAGWSPIAIREGLTETSQYWQKQFLRRPLYTKLLTNNHPMSATGVRGKRYMNLFVYWPAAVHPDLKNTLLICFGVGNTCKALTEIPSIRSIDVVDISRDILDSSEIMFPDKGDNPLHDPRVRTYVEDGRFFLQSSRKKYDLITGEPPPPTMAGVVNLYSQEYFQLIYDQLQERGIVTYWLPVDQLTLTSAKSILKAFCNVFQDCSLWTGTGFDWVIIGSRNGGAAVSEEHFSRQWRAAAASSDLRFCGFEEPAQLGATFLMDSHDLERFTAGSLPVVDDFPHRIAGEPSYLFNDFAEIMEIDRARERFERSPGIRRMWPDSVRKGTLDFFWVQGLLNRVLLKSYRHRIQTGHQDSGITMAALHAVVSRTTLRIPLLWMMGDDFGDMDRVMASGPAGSSDDAPGVDPLFLGSRAMADRDFLRAATYFAEAQKTAPDFIRYRIYSLCMAGRVDLARSLIRDHIGLFQEPGSKAFLSWLAETFDMKDIVP